MLLDHFSEAPTTLHYVYREKEVGAPAQHVTQTACYCLKEQHHSHKVLCLGTANVDQSQQYYINWFGRVVAQHNTPQHLSKCASLQYCKFCPPKRYSRDPSQDCFGTVQPFEYCSQNTFFLQPVTGRKSLVFSYLQWCKHESHTEPKLMSPIVLTQCYPPCKMPHAVKLQTHVKCIAPENASFQIVF